MSQSYASSDTLLTIHFVHTIEHVKILNNINSYAIQLLILEYSQPKLIRKIVEEGMFDNLSCSKSLFKKDLQSWTLLARSGIICDINDKLSLGHLKLYNQYGKLDIETIIIDLVEIEGDNSPGKEIISSLKYLLEKGNYDPQSLIRNFCHIECSPVFFIMVLREVERKYGTNHEYLSTEWLIDQL